MIQLLWKPAAASAVAAMAILWSAVSPTPSQARPDLKSIFQMLDRNHDGAITIDEFMRDASDPAVERMHHEHMKTGAASQMGAMHANMMKTAHGKSSDGALRAHFRELDANGDGRVTFAEFRAFHDRMSGDRPSR